MTTVIETPEVSQRERARLALAWIVWLAGVIALLGFAWSWYRALTGPTEVVSWVLIPGGVIAGIVLALRLAATQEGARIPTAILAVLALLVGRAHTRRAEEVLGEVPELLGWVPLVTWTSVITVIACALLLIVVPAERPTSDTVNNVVVSAVFLFATVFATGWLLDRDWDDALPDDDVETEEPVDA